MSERDGTPNDGNATPWWAVEPAAAPDGDDAAETEPGRPEGPMAASRRRRREQATSGPGDAAAAVPGGAPPPGGAAGSATPWATGAPAPAPTAGSAPPAAAGAATAPPAQPTSGPAPAAPAPDAAPSAPAAAPNAPAAAPNAPAAAPSTSTAAPNAPAQPREPAAPAPAAPQEPAQAQAPAPSFQATPPPTAPPPPPTAAAFNDQRMLRSGGAPPQRGWRRVVFKASGGNLNPGVSDAEQRDRDRIDRIRTPVSGCRKIAVVSRKGGVGKTTTTLMLGHTFAQYRGDRVVALDGNPDAGSLGYRVRRETTSTVTSLLQAGLLERYADIRAHTSQAASRLEVVASDDDPRVTEAMGEKEYRQAILQLERHYNLVMLDTGTGVLDSATQGILRVADQLVLVLAPSIDGARAASLTLDWMVEHGLRDMVEGSVAVINQTDGRSIVEVDRIEQHFAERCRATQRIPWDRHLGAGAESDLHATHKNTREAYLDLAAKVADGFRG
ncbi:MinD/ParA family protein [Nitriliruptoraceae bacterium ZYF776]|nr:MinD/ParA family protein [Profundirhabdus halotolerans]